MSIEQKNTNAISSIYKTITIQRSNFTLTGEAVGSVVGSSSVGAWVVGSGVSIVGSVVGSRVGFSVGSDWTFDGDNVIVGGGDEGAGLIVSITEGINDGSELSITEGINDGSELGVIVGILLVGSELTVGDALGKMSAVGLFDDVGD